MKPITSLPVGPPPPEVVLPTDFEGYVELTKKVSKGAMTDKAMIWATLALALAQKEAAEAQKAIAGHLEHLLEYLGAHDEAEDEQEPPRLADQLSMGLQTAIFTLKDDFARVAEATQEMISRANGEKK